TKDIPEFVGGNAVLCRGDSSMHRLNMTQGIRLSLRAGHAEIENGCGGECEQCDGEYGEIDAEQIREHAREDGPDGIAEVAPETEDADALCPVQRMGVFRNGREEGGIHHRRAPAE